MALSPGLAAAGCDGRYFPSIPSEPASGNNGKRQQNAHAAASCLFGKNFLSLIYAELTCWRANTAAAAERIRHICHLHLPARIDYFTHVVASADTCNHVTNAAVRSRIDQRFSRSKSHTLWRRRGRTCTRFHALVGAGIKCDSVKVLQH